MYLFLFALSNIRVRTHRFNKEFDSLVKQKHTDADRLTDLNTRVDELIRELVKIHLVLNPAAAAAAAAAADGTDAAAAGRGSTGGDAAAVAGSGASTARDGGAGQEALSAVQLSADLATGRLVPTWSPEENLEDILLKLQPGEIKVC
jgi:hypothetical protein